MTRTLLKRLLGTRLFFFNYLPRLYPLGVISCPSIKAIEIRFQTCQPANLLDKGSSSDTAIKIAPLHDTDNFYSRFICRKVRNRTCFLEHHPVSSIGSGDLPVSFLCRLRAEHLHNYTGFRLSRSLLNI